MVDYHTILPEDLAKRPVPAALKKYCIPLIEPVYFEDAACRILKQTWEDYADGMYIQFTWFEAAKSMSLLAVPSSGRLTGIIYIQKGSLFVREHSGGESLPRPEASLYMRRVNGEHASFILDFPGPGSYDIVYVSLSDRLFKKLLQGYPSLMKSTLQNGREVYRAGSRVKWLIEEMKSRDFNNIAEQATYFERRVQRLYDAFLDLSNAHTIDWQGMKRAFRMKVLKDYIDNNLGNDLTISNISKMLNMSGIGLRKSFKKIIGTPISTYIMKARIKESCNLLSTTNGIVHKGILSIAHEVGYNSLQGFGKAFRSVMHSTPEKYRNSAAKN